MNISNRCQDQVILPLLWLWYGENFETRLISARNKSKMDNETLTVTITQNNDATTVDASVDYSESYCIEGEIVFDDCITVGVDEDDIETIGYDRDDFQLFSKKQTPFVDINERKVGKLKITDEEILDKFDDYYKGLSERGCCYQYSSVKKMMCNCLEFLQNDGVRYAVCKFALEFGMMPKKQQKQKCIEWYRYANPTTSDFKVFLMPYSSEIVTTSFVRKKLNTPICSSALLAVLNIGKFYWKGIINSAITTASASIHGNTNKRNRSRKKDHLLELKLHSHFKELLSYSDVGATRFVR